jgi:hypothetical protein
MASGASILLFLVNCGVYNWLLAVTQTQGVVLGADNDERWIVCCVATN